MTCIFARAGTILSRIACVCVLGVFLPGAGSPALADDDEEKKSSSEQAKEHATDYITRDPNQSTTDWAAEQAKKEAAKRGNKAIGKKEDDSWTDWGLKKLGNGAVYVGKTYSAVKKKINSAIDYIRHPPLVDDFNKNLNARNEEARQRVLGASKQAFSEAERKEMFEQMKAQNPKLVGAYGADDNWSQYWYDMEKRPKEFDQNVGRNMANIDDFLKVADAGGYSDHSTTRQQDQDRENNRWGETAVKNVGEGYTKALGDPLGKGQEGYEETKKVLTDIKNQVVDPIEKTGNAIENIKNVITGESPDKGEGLDKGERVGIDTPEILKDPNVKDDPKDKGEKNPDDKGTGVNEDGTGIAGTDGEDKGGTGKGDDKGTETTTEDGTTIAEGEKGGDKRGDKPGKGGKGGRTPDRPTTDTPETDDNPPPSPPGEGDVASTPGNEPQNDAGEKVGANGFTYGEGDRVIVKDGTEYVKHGDNWEKTGDNYGTYDPEAGSDGETPSGGHSPGSTLDIFSKNQDAGRHDKSDSGFTGMKSSTAIAKGSTAGDAKVTEAKHTRNRGGADAGAVGNKAASDTAAGDRDSGWNKAIGDAVQSGLEAGLGTAGAALGNAFAGQAASEIFKGGKPTSSDTPDTDDGHQKIASTASPSRTSSSSGGSKTGSSRKTKKRDKDKSSSDGSTTTNAPTTAPTEPTTAPTEPTTAPSEPTTASTPTTTVPTEPTTASTPTTTASTPTTTVDTRYKCPACGSRNTTFSHSHALYGDVYKCHACGGTVHDI